MKYVECKCLRCGRTEHVLQRLVGSWVCNQCGEVRELVPKPKPPIGIMPRRLCKVQRLVDLHGAIQRYLTAELEINLEWVDEYNLLTREQVNAESNEAT